MPDELTQVDNEPLSDLEMLHDAIRVEQGRSRRVMLWFITVFLFILLVVLAMFLFAGIFILRNSQQMVATVEEVGDVATVNAFQISGISNRLARVEGVQMRLSAKLNAAGGARSQDVKAIESEQRRHSKWIDGIKRCESPRRKYDLGRGKRIEISLGDAQHRATHFTCSVHGNG